jgi:hypothetical protein
MDSHPLRLAPALLLPALICFFLPFVECHFHYEQTDRLTGINFLLGPSLHLSGDNGTNDIKPDPFMNIALPAAIAAFIVALFPGRKNRIAGSILAAVAASALLYMQGAFDVTLDHFQVGTYTLDYQPAFYVLLSLLAITAAAGVPFAALIRLLRRIPIPRYTLKRVDNAAS